MRAGNGASGEVDSAGPQSRLRCFHEAGGIVAVGGEDSNLDSGSLPKDFDGLIFVEETHAARPLAAPAGGR
jgi:hypothetical protein